MDQVRQGHRFTALTKQREVEDQAGNAQGAAQHGYQPEPGLFTAVEATGTNVATE